MNTIETNDLEVRMRELLERTGCPRQRKLGILRAIGCLLNGYEAIQGPTELAFADKILDALKQEFENTPTTQLDAVRRRIQDDILQNEPIGCLPVIILALSALLLLIGRAVADEAPKPTSTTPLSEQLRLVPILQLSEDWVGTAWGWTDVNFKKKDNLPGEAAWSMTRINSKLQGPSAAFGLVLELADLQSDSVTKNCLREAWAEVKLDDRLRLRGGMILLACGPGNEIAGPPFWPTEEYPKIPFGAYATGLQLLWNAEAWSAIWDITGKSGEPFDSPNRFQRLETSLLVKHKLSDILTLGASAQLCRDFQRGGVFADWNGNNWFGRAEFDYSNNSDGKTSNSAGGYLLLGTHPAPQALSGWKLYAEGALNAQLPKYWEELVKSKGKDGKIKYQTVTKHSLDQDDVSVIFGTSYHFGGDDPPKKSWFDLLLKLEYLQSLHEDSSGKLPSGELRGQGQWRF